MLTQVSQQTSLEPAVARFLPHHALHQRMNAVRTLPGLARLTVAVEDQSQCTFGDIFWAVKSWIINLGALAIATHLKQLGAGTVHAYYPIMRGRKLSTPYDLVGLSCSEVSVAACVERLAHLRKQFGPDMLIIVGGPGMENWWERLLAGGADGVISGDGQFPVTQLLESVLPQWTDGVPLGTAFRAAREAGALDEVRDLAFLRADGTPQRNARQGLVQNLDEYPAVDYSLIQGASRAHIKCVHHSSGCVYRCGFCSSIINQRHSYRQVSVERLLDDLELAQGQGYAELFCASDLFLPGNVTANRAMLGKLADGRAARGLTIRMSSQTTVGSLHDLILANTGTLEDPQWQEDSRGIALLKAVGAFRWSLGVEAFTQQERARLRKDPRQKDSNAARTLECLCNNGMDVHAMMMVHEDTTLERAWDIGRTLGDIGVGTAQFFHPVPAPQTPWGTELFQRDDILLGTVGGEPVAASRCTGEYVVAGKRPEHAILAVETCYDSFTSTGNILRDLGRGRVEKALFKMGIRFLVFARRYLVPQYYRYTGAVLRGDFKYWAPGDDMPAGPSLTHAGGLRPSLATGWALWRKRRAAYALERHQPTVITPIAQDEPTALAAAPVE